MMKGHITDSTNARVCILMSTYNGALYLKDQLDSIFRQTHQNLELLVRDDGSTDSTKDILSEYCKLHPNMHYYQGENLKPARSFLDLIQKAPVADFYAFSDQDDVWLPDKLSAAIDALQKSKADFYYSQTTPVDSKLQVLRVKPLIPMNTLESSLVYASVTGCTVVFSKCLRDTVIRYRPNFIMMHDSWIYKITLALGRNVFYDNKSFILYRQHGHNVVGARRSLGKRLSEKFYALLYPTNSRLREAQELYNGYEDIMPNKEKETIKMISRYQSLSIWNRMKLAISSDYRCKAPFADINFLFAILLKRF